MKNRVKSFIKKHNVEIYISAIGGIAVGAVCMAAIKNNEIDGMRIASGDLFDCEDGSKIFSVYHVNGTTSSLKLVEENS